MALSGGEVAAVVLDRTSSSGSGGRSRAPSPRGSRAIGVRRRRPGRGRSSSVRKAGSSQVALQLGGDPSAWPQGERLSRERPGGGGPRTSASGSNAQGQVLGRGRGASRPVEPTSSVPPTSSMRLGHAAGRAGSVVPSSEQPAGEAAPGPAWPRGGGRRRAKSSSATTPGPRAALGDEAQPVGQDRARWGWKSASRRDPNRLWQRDQRESASRPGLAAICAPLAAETLGGTGACRAARSLWIAPAETPEERSWRPHRRGDDQPTVRLVFDSGMARGDAADAVAPSTASAARCSPCQARVAPERGVPQAGGRARPGPPAPSARRPRRRRLDRVKLLGRRAVLGLIQEPKQLCRDLAARPWRNLDARCGLELDEKTGRPGAPPRGRSRSRWLSCRSRPMSARDAIAVRRKAGRQARPGLEHRDDRAGTVRQPRRHRAADSDSARTKPRRPAWFGSTISGRGPPNRPWAHRRNGRRSGPGPRRDQDRRRPPGRLHPAGSAPGRTLSSVGGRRCAMSSGQPRIGLRYG